MYVLKLTKWYASGEDCQDGGYKWLQCYTRTANRGGPRKSRDGSFNTSQGSSFVSVGRPQDFYRPGIHPAQAATYGKTKSKNKKKKKKKEKEKMEIFILGFLELD